MTDHYRPVALEHASRLINHGPTVLVTSVASRPAAPPGSKYAAASSANRHTEDAYDTCFAEVAAAADECIFSGGRWTVRADNIELHTIHHLGAGTFAQRAMC